MVAVTKADSQMTPIRVVVTCTNRKSRPVPAKLRLRNVTGVRLPTRIQAWTARLQEMPVPAVPAIDMYAGEHWDVARSLGGGGDTRAKVELWVCSAGYGLIPATAPILPYAATFAAGTPDSVPGGADGATAWWNALSEWHGPTGDVRSLHDLVGSTPKSRVLLVASASYLAACRDDLGLAVGQIGDDKRLSIICAGTRDDEFKECLLPCDARLQTALGGTRQALNVRAAEYLLTAGIVDHDEMSDALAKLLADQPGLTRYERRPASDAEVRSFIRSRLRTDPSASHTRLLRQFRNENRACEQSRFAGLFRAETRVRS